ncbi:hypothetical protein H257_05023 [Aphanomyces astaci]|uniref:HTH La-type RNA-binding domain-containing protein n=1 Tax=Aphanomyces astaci TaxID=112090 RepID=W4GRL5_APHAT|nr:hypothetical protein H257_05023 [Aphanomyces astaci]ETV82370.1 hypothetical protein H257_05023 [Aphanomyces astaci]|eukprot:XP_009828039.1 hypothetical protein H257_05023 [Aphanomyces astaci]
MLVDGLAGVGVDMTGANLEITLNSVLSRIRWQQQPQRRHLSSTAWLRLKRSTRVTSSTTSRLLRPTTKARSKRTSRSTTVRSIQVVANWLNAQPTVYSLDTVDAKNNGAPSGARRGGGGGRGWKNAGGRGGRGGRNFDSTQGAYVNGVFVPTTDVAVTADYAKTQIEFFLSPDNLVRDTFLRQHMDVDGYVPVAFVGSFQSVYSIHQDYPSLLAAMKTSTLLEYDDKNEKVRPQDWQKWLWPTADGQYGVPRYIKVLDDAAAVHAE